MKKLKDFLGLIRLFFTLVLSMIYHFHNLNDDLENNFMICKKICKRVIKTAKIDLHIYDQESLPADKHFLLVPNHRCFFGPIRSCEDIYPRSTVFRWIVIRRILPN